MSTVLRPIELDDISGGSFTKQEQYIYDLIFIWNVVYLL